MSHPGSINITWLEGTPTYLILGGFDNPDSDVDGLTDGDEVYVYGTNCTLCDTDGDGFSDGGEVSWGTDPLSWTLPSEIIPPPPLIPSVYGIALLVGVGLGLGGLIGAATVLFRKREAPSQVKKKAEKPKKTEEKAGG
jgi:hypothetical protein